MAIDFSDSSSTVSSAEKNSSSSLMSMKIGPGAKLNSNHRKLFTEQLALLLETGNTLHGSLDVLRNQTDHELMIAMLDDLHDKVTKGQTFSQALRSHSKLFSQTYITLVAAGEEGGYLPTVLDHLLDMEVKREELRSMVVSAFTYPVILILFSIIIVVFVLTSVFPKFTVMFESSGTSLPLVTQILMSASDLLIAYWWVLVGGITAIALYVRMLIAQPKIRARLDEIFLTMPIVGGLTSRLYLTHMMRLLTLSLGNGVTLLDALTICKEASSNNAFQNFVQKLIDNVSEGKSLGVGFREAKFVPQLIKQMIQTGEESGQLPLVTGRVADYYQRDLGRKLDMLSKIIEPVMLLGMGIFVSFIVSALILPIFKLSSGVH